MRNNTEIEQLEEAMSDAVDRMVMCDLNEKICLAHQDSNMAAYWALESRKSWKKSEDLRIKLNKLLGDGAY